MFLHCFLTVHKMSETNKTNVQMSSEMHMPRFSQSSCPTSYVASWHQLCVLSNCFYPSNWHISWLVRWSGALHMLVLAPWHMLKLTCQQRQWCCHCRHLNKKCCKYFESRYVLARWQSCKAFVVQHEATDSSESGDGGRVRPPCKGKRNACMMHAHTQAEMQATCVWDIWRILNKRRFLS